MVIRFIASLLLIFSLCTSFAWSDNSSAYTREDLEEMMTQTSPAIIASEAQIELGEAVIKTAQSLPNPDIEFTAGQHTVRSPSAVGGKLLSIAITQPLDLAFVRTPRILAASAGLTVAKATHATFRAERLSKLRAYFYDVLRRQAEYQANLEDLSLIENIRKRVALRVEIGEASRFELVKADTELLNMQKIVQSSLLKVKQSKVNLRLLVGPGLPNSFSITDNSAAIPQPPDVKNLLDNAVKDNPDIVRARAAQQRAEYLLEYQKAQAWPMLAVKASFSQEPDIRNTQLGLVLSLPLFNKREGPIAEAKASVSQARHESAQQEFALRKLVENAYTQYQISQAQIAALESGIIKQAETALNIAESAYRYGERSFLDVLDAQRVYRAARNELITARYELAIAWTEIERLRASVPLKKDTLL